MSYRLAYTLRAVKDIDRLDAGVKKRIGATLLRFKDNPLQYAERLTDPELGGYRFRIGDYRVIFDIEGNDIVVLHAGHRKEIYKRK
ncbi:MAG: type II toxin-antitoxin system RelE/ParE family toxin [Proteobacteria bacterium]|nr:type II toxin-antitoxin system RelE/ParE family toxin [Pseudomonadota bacterium]MBU4582033.1 type II toxin-antitoxin system RelE/ParE family toxin [Pseudomonadota bacterium]MCG2740154.1 type II toxin-antitoxin system RelE/ParE family toxin [Syntrophaceae bacterium]